MIEYLKKNYEDYYKIFLKLRDKYGRNYYEKEELIQEMLIVFLKLDLSKGGLYIWSCLENCCKKTIAKINSSNSLLNKRQIEEYRNLLFRFENKQKLTKLELDILNNYENLHSIQHNSPEYFEALTYDIYDFNDSVIELLDNDYDKQILKLSFYEGLTDGEIGKELNKSRTTIRDRKKKILRDLKEILLDLGIDEDILKDGD